MGQHRLDYEPPPADTRRLSAFAVASFCLSIAAIPCITGHLMVMTFVPGEVFNSVDLSYRAVFWNGVAALPAFATLVLNGAAAYRVGRSRRVRGAGLSVAGVIVSLLWIGLALAGLGVMVI